MIRPTAPVAVSVVLRDPLQVVSAADSPDVVKHINDTRVVVTAFVATTSYCHVPRLFTMDLIFSPYLLSVA